MHVVMFGDQHVESSGGAQVSMRLQRAFLERAGHTVTIVQPRLHARRVVDAAYVDVPSMPVTPDREYAMFLPGARTDRAIDRALAARPPVDVVHVQADFWGAIAGHRFAARHRLPVVHTMHNRVDVGIRATTPFPRLVLRVLNAWVARMLPGADPRRAARISEDQREGLRESRVSPRIEHGTDGWAYLRRFGIRSDAVTAPSAHFAGRLEEHGVADGVDVVWNGIDDDVLDAARDPDGATRTPGRPRLVWVGRMSAEKRLLPFLEAIAESGIDADVEIIGGGGQRRAAERLVRRRGLAATVRFAGRLPYRDTLARIAAADAVVQTSIGFETQGMTVFEAAALGVPAIVSDPDIAAELGTGCWQVGGTDIPALAAALGRAVIDIRDGLAPQPEPRIAEEFRQSSRTAAMLAVYGRVLTAPR